MAPGPLGWTVRHCCPTGMASCLWVASVQSLEHLDSDTKAQAFKWPAGCPRARLTGICAGAVLAGWIWGCQVGRPDVQVPGSPDGCARAKLSGRPCQCRASRIASKTTVRVRLSKDSPAIIRFSSRPVQKIRMNPNGRPFESPKILSWRAFPKIQNIFHQK